MIFLDFEKAVEELYNQLQELKKDASEEDDDKQAEISALEKKIASTRKKIYSNLTGWQRVQLSRHPERPYTLYYLSQICSRFVEMHGDRCFADDKAMVGGIGSLDNMTVMFVGQQKGENTKMRQYRNFGMPNPEGYRKALRMFKTAERFNIPVVCLIDTPGAFPGIEAEDRGQAEAIARNLFEMARLRVPIVCVIIGEGASGGALGIGVGNRVLMMENTWYTVISPESCSTILWRTVDNKKQAADALKLTAENALELGIIDEIIPEPLGGAHANPEEMAKILKKVLKKEIAALQKMTPEELHRQELKRIGYKDEVIEVIVNKYIQNAYYEFAEQYHNAKLESQKDNISIPCTCGNNLFIHRHSNWIVCAKCNKVKILTV